MTFSQSQHSWQTSSYSSSSVRSILLRLRLIPSHSYIYLDFLVQAWHEYSEADRHIVLQSLQDLQVLRDRNHVVVPSSDPLPLPGTRTQVR